MDSLTALSTVTAGSPAVVQSASRLPWVDNLRTTVVILVVHMHSHITYSHVGDWYLKDGPEGTLTEKLPSIFWIFHLQSFFMGLLFFLAGAMADGALRRHGSGSFLRERALRLGAPALLYMMVLHPLIVFGLLGVRGDGSNTSGISAYAIYLTAGQVFSGSGPLWFALALLLFSTVLVVWRVAVPIRAASDRTEGPKAQTILTFALALAAATSLTRSFFPIGTSVLNFQLCYFPQYTAAFAVGVVAGNSGWLNTIAASRIVRNWGYVALVGGPVCLGSLIWLGGGPVEGPGPGEHEPILYFGGWTLQAYAASTWEQVTGVGLALGSMALFQQVFDRAGTVSRWLASRSFAVYLFHAPVLVCLTLQFRSMPVSQPAKIALLTIVGLVLSFAIADVVKRVPWLGRFT